MKKVAMLHHPDFEVGSGRQEDERKARRRGRGNLAYPRSVQKLESSVSNAASR